MKKLFYAYVYAKISCQTATAPRIKTREGWKPSSDNTGFCGLFGMLPYLSICTISAANNDLNG